MGRVWYGMVGVGYCRGMDPYGRSRVWYGRVRFCWGRVWYSMVGVEYGIGRVW